MSNPPKIVRVNDPASAFTLVAIAASILLLYSLSRIISLQRRVRDLESRPPVDDIVMRGMIRQQINDTFQTYERRRAAEQMELKAREKPEPKPEPKIEIKEPKPEPKIEIKAEPKEEPQEPTPETTKTEKELEAETKQDEQTKEYTADNEYEEVKAATKTIRKRSTKPKAAL